MSTSDADDGINFIFEDNGVELTLMKMKNMHRKKLVLA
jgi:hypothetical protein